MDFLFLKLWYEEFSQKFSETGLNKIGLNGSMYHLNFLQGSLHVLLHSGDPIIFFDDKSKQDMDENGFTRVCREHITKAELNDIKLAENDKILTLNFKKTDMFGQEKNYSLFLELINRYENLILLEKNSDSNDLMIIGAHKKVGIEDSKFRQILPGGKYKPPPQLKGPFILELSQQEFVKIVGNKLNCDWKEFIKNFSNMPKFLKKFYKAGAPASEFWHKVEKLKDKIISFRNNSQKVFYNYGSKRLSFFESDKYEEFSNMNDAFKFYYSYKIKQKQKHDLKENILNKMLQRKEALQNKIDLSKKRLEELKQAPKWKKYGELLKSNLHKIKKGQESVQVIDYYDEDQPKIKIPLNPRWNPQKNMRNYFKMFKKAKSGKGKLKKFIESSRKELEKIKKKIKKIKDSENYKYLKNKENMLFPEEQSGEGKQQKKQKFRRFTVAVGQKKWRIYVGRTSKENDELTIQFANSEDWFFHSRIYHGSHVVVKNDEKRDSLPKKIISFAASTAAHFSKAKHSKKVPVDYTKIKYVRKPRKSTPGFVVYDHQKTVFVEPHDPRKR